MKFNYVGIDTETTGLDPNSDEILEVVAIEFNLSGEIGETFHQLCKPMSEYISPKITEINNITMEMVKDKPSYLKDDVYKKVAEFIKGRTIVGHNAIAFDLPFMRIKTDKCEDTLRMARKKFSGRHNLKACCKKMGIEWNDKEAHRAEYDTLKTIELFCRMKDAEEKKIEANAQIPLFGDLEAASPSDIKKLGIVPTGEDKRMMATQAYSFSRINLYNQCPFKWYMQYIKGVKEPKKDYFDTGKICHSVAEWSGDWCYRTLFANKFQVYFTNKKFEIGPKTKEGLAKYFKKDVPDVTPHDFGLYLYDKPSKIPVFFKESRGKADLIRVMDSCISVDQYEKPSMPTWDIYEQIIEEAINKHKCSDPDVINDAKKIMTRFYDLKDFSLMPGDITITEKRLAFDKEWNVLSDFYANNVFFRGIIDVIDYFGDYVVITDYKSSRTMMTEAQLKEDPQMRIYLLLIYMLLPKDSYKKIVIRIEYLRFGKSIEYEVSDVKAVAEKGLKWINDSIQSIEKEMLKTDGTAFRPTRNEYCHTCHLAEDAKCPFFDKRKINNIDDPLIYE